MNVQAPPNLSPTEHRLLLRSGINDWGGISPVTKDYVNPEAAWPQIAQLNQTCRDEGFTLRERLAIYPEYLQRTGFVPVGLRELTLGLAKLPSLAREGNL
jgi:2-iminoacetate synthase ThiH